MSRIDSRADAARSAPAPSDPATEGETVPAPTARVVDHRPIELRIPAPSRWASPLPLCPLIDSRPC